QEHGFLEKFYSKCKKEITEPNLTATAREINAVLRKVGIVRWPMLEVIDNPNISNILYESFSLFGLSGLFSLTLETYPAHQHLALGRVYGFKIGPPVFAFASELRAKQASSDSAVLASYEESITAIAHTFRSGIPLQGIAREIVLLQHYLRQMTILKPSIKDYSDNNVTLVSLSLDQNMLDWYRLLVRIQERTTDRSHQNMSEPGSQVVAIWDKKYLHCINRLFKIEKTTVIVNSGDERSDDFLASWDDGQDFVGVIVNKIINETSKQMRSLWENTSDSCEECSALSPFSHEIQYIHRRNVIVIPALLLPSENSLLGLPPIYAFSSLGGIIATKMMEIILFDG
ncbi:unnamed protein product, partial [Ixodes persulcatus]